MLMTYYTNYQNSNWRKNEKIHDYRTRLIGRNKKNPSEVAFQLYDPYHFYPYLTDPHQNRYDLTENVLYVCGTIQQYNERIDGVHKAYGCLVLMTARFQTIR